MLFHIFISDWEDVMENFLRSFQTTEMWGQGKTAIHKLHEVQDKCQVLAMAQKMHIYRLGLTI